jgi:HlyD family secretion protein
MKKKRIIIGCAVICLITAAYFVFGNSAETTTKITVAKISRGDINYTITCTGTIEATSTVDVGTQVSGKIARLFVDFNSEVKKGQLLAIIDTVTLVAQVRDAKANLAKAKAEYKQKLTLHEKNKKLFEKNFISELDFIESETNVESVQASLSSAESALDKAVQNLDYAYIYAPISGRIIDRSVEEGQTVAASMSTPTLFTIAQDLSSMRILASVDESDIGQIKEGQKVKFTVQAYSDKTFSGDVTQIRLKSSSSSNVVNYTVVISADNREGFLLPGMTATVDFYVENRENVLLLPNTALRIEPSEKLLVEIKKNMEADRPKMSDGSNNKSGTPPPPPQGGMPRGNGISQSKEKSSFKKVYYVDENGKYKMTPVVVGLTDGKNTEIVMSRELKEGTKIITGIQDREEAASTKKSSNSGIMNSTPQGGPPPPMM